MSNGETAVVPADSFDVMKRMAESISKSQLFGMQSANQVFALMLVAQAEGRHPASVARDYDIIQGRPAKRAEAMLRDFQAAGGSVEWHTLTDEKVDATFTHPQGTARVEWTMERARKAGLAGKDNYKKYPRQMLRCRCTAEGVRATYPGATSGMYAPEEIIYAEALDSPKGAEATAELNAAIAEAESGDDRKEDETAATAGGQAAADSTETNDTQSRPDSVDRRKQLAEQFHAMCQSEGVDSEWAYTVLFRNAGVKDRRGLTIDHYKDAIADFRSIAKRWQAANEDQEQQPDLSSAVAVTADEIGWD